MSTFVYQNGVLHADTRKIVNFPGREMITTQFESKVKSFGWCYVAAGGFEASGIVTQQILKTLTVVQACETLKKVVRESVAGGRKKGLTDFTCDVRDFGNLFLEAQAKVFGTQTFLAITREIMIGCEGELGYGGKGELLVKTTDDIEVIGSCQHGARILLLNGVPPKDIYPILRAGNAPTGEICETFELKNLKPLAAPWLDSEVWLYGGIAIKSQTPNLTGEQKNMIADMMTIVSKFGKYKWKRNYPNAEFIAQTINEWSDKKHRELPGYKTIRKSLFK